jgi:hypothetical protein
VSFLDLMPGIRCCVPDTLLEFRGPRTGFSGSVPRKLLSSPGEPGFNRAEVASKWDFLWDYGIINALPLRGSLGPEQAVGS